jgi:hypothetical protein
MDEDQKKAMGHKQHPGASNGTSQRRAESPSLVAVASSLLLACSRALSSFTCVCVTGTNEEAVLGLQ